MSKKNKNNEIKEYVNRDKFFHEEIDKIRKSEMETHHVNCDAEYVKNMERAITESKVENANIMYELSKYRIKLNMATQFKLKGPNDEVDIYSAIGTLIPDPNDINRHDIDLLPNVKRVWVIRGSGSVFMNSEGQWHIPNRIEPKSKFDAEKKVGGTAIIEESDVPTFETMDEMFEAYNKFWNTSIGILQVTDNYKNEENNDDEVTGGTYKLIDGKNERTFNHKNEEIKED